MLARLCAAFAAVTLALCGMLLAPGSALADDDALTMQVLDASGNELSNNATTTPSSYRSTSGTVRLNVTLNKGQTGNVVTATLPKWFSWYGTQDGIGYSVEVTSGADGTNNVLKVTFDDPSSDGVGYGLDFNFRLNDASMTASTIQALENGGLTNMTFSASLTNSAGTITAPDLTLGYAWDSPANPSIPNLYVGPIGNLYALNGLDWPTPGVVQTGIYNDLNKNTNTLSQVVLPATDPFRYGRAIESIQITLDSSASDIYKINGIVNATSSGRVSSFENYTVEVSDDGNSLTLTPKDYVSSVDLKSPDKSRIVGAVDLGFRLANGSTYDRDKWYDALTNGPINSGNLLHVTVKYKDFTSSGASTSSTEATSTMTVVNYEQADPSVRQSSADTSTYLTNQRLYGDDPITVAAVVDEAGAADQTVWIGENLGNLVGYSSSKATIPKDASGYALVTEYPYEVRGTEFQIRPKYAATASTLADQFSPGGFELEKVVFTLSDGSTVEVSANNATFASDWNTALSSNGTMTVTADQLGVASSFDSSNEGTVKYVTKVTQVFKTAKPSIITDTSNYWSFRMTKWSMTTYEQYGTTKLGTGSLTHANGTVEENGKRWYPITSTLYTDENLGTQVATAEHDIQVRQEVCPEFEMVSASGSSVLNYSSWKLNSDNENGNFLDLRVVKGTNLNNVMTQLENPVIGIDNYWMDNIYTLTGEMDVSRAMIGWKITYGVTTYAKASAGEQVEVREHVITESDFASASDEYATIDLLPNTGPVESGSDWEYFAASSAVGTRGNYSMYIKFSYDGIWDLSTVSDADGDKIMDSEDGDGILVRNIKASSRATDPDGQYSYYLWWNVGQVLDLDYQWTNCQDNEGTHLAPDTW